MRPLTLLGLVFAAFGAAVILFGGGMALWELIGLYQGAMSNPLGQPEGTEDQVSLRMWQYVLIGAAGAPFLIIGSIMLKVTVIQQIRRRLTPRDSGPSRP